MPPVARAALLDKCTDPVEQQPRQREFTVRWIEHLFSDRRESEFPWHSLDHQDLYLAFLAKDIDGDVIAVA